MININLIQMTSHGDVAQNMATAEQRIRKLPRSEHPRLVILPECFAVWGSASYQLRHAEADHQGPLQQQISDWARRYDCYILAGTLPICTASQDKVTATSLLFDRDGQRLARYDKIHLFDVDVADNTHQYRESNHTEPGDAVVVVNVAGVRVGLAICYDIRFPELFRQMVTQGVDLIVLPSAFTRVTGEAHWHTLLRARAIENQCYIVAACQVGTHDNGRETYGHSIIIDGWGRIIADAGTTQRSLSATIDPSTLNVLHNAMPVLKHRRLN